MGLTGIPQLREAFGVETLKVPVLLDVLRRLLTACDLASFSLAPTSTALLEAICADEFSVCAGDVQGGEC